MSDDKKFTLTLTKEQAIWLCDLLDTPDDNSEECWAVFNQLYDQGVCELYDDE